MRFADDPKLLAVEWEDGAPPCQFVTPARDAVLAALLGAAQAASGRPIAVMPGGCWSPARTQSVRYSFFVCS